MVKKGGRKVKKHNKSRDTVPKFKYINKQKSNSENSDRESGFSQQKYSQQISKSYQWSQSVSEQSSSSSEKFMQSCIQSDPQYQKLVQNLQSNQFFGRQSQAKVIVQFLTDDSLENCILYLIGKPGTGKTSLVNHLLTNYQGQSILKINAMKLVSTTGIKQLDHNFAKKYRKNQSQRQPLRFIVIDEFDQIQQKQVNKLINQIIVHHFKNKLPLKIILISNNDKKDSIKINTHLFKVSVSILYFLPYNLSEFCEILSRKLKDSLCAYSSKQIQLASRLSVNKNGDFRYAVEILKGAYLNMRQRSETLSLVLQSDITKYIQEWKSSSHNQQLNICKTFIEKNTLLQNKILYFIAKNQKQINIYKMQKQENNSKIQCRCYNKLIINNIYFSLQLQSVISLQQLRFSLRNWARLQIVGITNFKCKLHHRIYQKYWINPKFLQVINRETQNYFYRHDMKANYI